MDQEEGGELRAHPLDGAKTPFPLSLGRLKASWKRGGFLGNGKTHFILLPVSQRWETLLICGNSFCSLVKINVQCRQEIQLRLPERKGYSLEGGDTLSAEGEQGWMWNLSQLTASTCASFSLPGKQKTLPFPCNSPWTCGNVPSSCVRGTIGLGYRLLLSPIFFESGETNWRQSFAIWFLVEKGLYHLILRRLWGGPWLFLCRFCPAGTMPSAASP